MKTKEQKIEFAISQLMPYIENPKLCGFDENSNKCRYFFEGKSCVAGKNFLPKILKKYKNSGNTIGFILKKNNNDQKKVFKKSSVDILSTEEWGILQFAHDAIAKGGKVTIDNITKIFE